MIRAIITKRSTQETIADELVTDNWWKVYEDIARHEGRRINRISKNAIEIIFTEKDKTVTLIK